MMSTRRHEYKKDNHAVPLGLYDIIEVNEEKMTVTCEPLVNVGHVTGTLVPRGLTLPVVPEMDDLTIGGLLAGYGIEASSHKYGLFNDIVVSVELVTSEGSVIKCSREENSDLFHAIPWSYGGLGFVTAVEIKMIRAQPFVRIEYVPYTDYDKLMKDFAAESMKTKDGHEFLEIIQYSKTTAVFMKADFASAESASYWQRNSIGLWYKPWFYKHVESVLSRPKGAPLVEYIPLREYYHRHTRSIFWELELLIPFGNNPLFRLLAGWMMPPKVSFIRLTEGELLHKYHREKHVAQDVLVPLDRVKACVEHFDKIFDIYPLWIVPHAVYRTEPQGAIRIADGKDEEMYADVGVWFAPGPVRKNEPYDAMAAIHNMEQWLIANRGYQALYAFSMLSREDHRKMFDMSLYDSLRKKYKADGAFLDVYEKIKKNH
jgi:delta24-sterol reductase